MEIFYTDGQSIGNERRGATRSAKIVFVQWSSNPAQSRVYWKDVGNKTNNEAEYLALLEALRFISDRWDNDERGTPERGVVEIRSDSEFMVKQIRGENKVREARLKPLWKEAQIIIARLGFVGVRWVSREENYAGLWLEGRWTAASVHKM